MEGIYTHTHTCTPILLFRFTIDQEVAAARNVLNDQPRFNNYFLIGG